MKKLARTGAKRNVVPHVLTLFLSVMEGFKTFEEAPERSDMVRVVWHKDETCYKLPFAAMRMLSSHKEISQEEFTSKTLPALSLLPCRVRPSPVYCMLTYNKEKPWVPYTTTVIQTVWNLYQIVGWFWASEEDYRVRGNKKLANALRQVLEDFKEKQRIQMDEQLAKELETFHRRMVDNGVVAMNHPDARACMMDLAQNVLWPYTIKLVHALERCVYACANLEQPFMRPVEQCLTSSEPITAIHPLPDAQAAKDMLQMSAWFQNKQSYAIGLEAIDEHDKLRKNFVMRLHIDHDMIAKVMQRWRNDPANVWERSIPYVTLWQYCMFLDRTTHILGKASEGFVPDGRIAPRDSKLAPTSNGP